MKKRVTKDPELRKEEFVLAAAHLFREKGYENTSVSDIVHKLHVAQGTFYYYFTSKDSVLEAVVRRITDEYEGRMRKAMKDAGDSAEAQLAAILRLLSDLISENSRVLEFLHKPENTAMHVAFMQIGFARMAPLFAETVELGVKQGVFQVKYPQEASEYLIAAMSHFIHHPDIRDPGPRRTRLYEELEELVGRLLRSRSEGLMRPLIP